MTRSLQVNDHVVMVMPYRWSSIREGAKGVVLKAPSYGGKDSDGASFDLCLVRFQGHDKDAWIDPDRLSVVAQ